MHPSNYIAIIPAAGKGSRLGKIGHSKELLPVDAGDKMPAGNRTMPVAAFLINRLRDSGIKQVHLITRAGKTDIVEHFQSGKSLDVQMTYSITETDAGVPFTIDEAYSCIQDKNVLFGFPDILFYPANAFVGLMDQLAKQPTLDLVLGLFPVKDPENWDTVALGAKGEVLNLVIKEKRDEPFSPAWIIAAWRPSFSAFIHRKVEGIKAVQAQSGQELYMGHVIQMALDEGLQVGGRLFKSGKCHDVGTPEGYARANAFIHEF